MACLWLNVPSLPLKFTYYYMLSLQKYATLFFLLFLIGQQRSLAQSADRLQPGYIIPLQGDTVRGFVEPLARFVTAQGIGFRTAASTPSQRYQPEQLRGFGLAGGKSYVTRPVLLGTRDTLRVFLEHLIAGGANLYRLDYEIQRAVDPMSLQRYNTTFYYIDLNGTMPLLLQEETYRGMLKNVFSACPAVSAKPISRFDQPHLVEAVLRYNEQCQTSRPTRDLRPPVNEEDRSRVVLSLRVGAGLNTLSYDQNATLDVKQAEATSGLAAALQVRLATKHAFSVESGVQYAHKETNFSQTSTVPTGFRNAGEQLTLTSRMEFTSIQAPLVLRYTVGRGRLQPYLFGGALIGGHLARQTMVGLPATVYTPPTGTGPGVIDQRQESRSEAGRSFAVALGGHFGAGILLGKGRRAPLLEIYYDMGREIFEKAYMGAVQYRTLSVMLGMEF